jgi:clan AA aspartic protease (TIGR02281 family)
MRHYAKVLRATLTALLVLVAMARAAVSGPFEDATAAYQRGDYATAYRLVRPLADQGNAGAQISLGLMYSKGEGVPQNYTEAMKWFRLAADQGVPEAQFTLGRMYHDGEGVPLDYAEATKWYRKAADQGFALAQSNLGIDYAKGRGVPQDLAEAEKWFRKGAEQGIAFAQDNLGILYASGQGVPQDFAEAAKWFRKAADQGNTDAQLKLGAMYVMGQGVPQDYVLAHMWLNLAASQFQASEKEKRDNAVMARDIAASKMTPAQIAEAQKLTREHMSSSRIEVPLKKDGGTFAVPAQINSIMTLDFMVDSGASDVTVPLNVFFTLKRKGTIKDTDITGVRPYTLADGSARQSRTFTIRSLKVGDIVVENVKGSVEAPRGRLLLGQSFLEHFKSWSIDNTKHVLLLEPQ